MSAVTHAAVERYARAPAEATRPALAPPRVLMTSPAAFTAFTVVIKMCSNPM